MTFNLGLSCRKRALEARAEIIRQIRRFFYEEGFLETETPLRIPAPAPESHIDAVPSLDWFLQTSPELAMKRLLAAGYGKIFQICRCWRQGERGRLHLPEFTMIEWYRAGADYLDLMDDCEALIGFVSAAMGNGKGVRYNSLDIDLNGRWERITVADAFRRFTPLSMEDALDKGLFDELMVEAIEPNLGVVRPAFIHDYPASRGALAKLKTGNPDISERFELYMGGVELANAFTELTDATEQRSRFVQEQDYRISQGKRSYPMPGRFLDELPHMPPSAGIALGLDRLVMVLLDASSIDEVVAFTPEEL